MNLTNPDTPIIASDSSSSDDRSPRSTCIMPLIRQVPCSVNHIGAENQDAGEASSNVQRERL
ncbi:hypothetical protein F2Q70_00030136 [Brassica cretica]|uniref:Uncharacterized protein n=1 Tax=Brassica cretica TaxID=69181 RepID=A0A8S9FD74_BRACR|nr:hypothetical protein F2Q70_00030136 [Brassica cretica]KAF3486214.1 hypothetical protein F2Q69_00053407 [Brassica cretica]